MNHRPSLLIVSIVCLMITALLPVQSVHAAGILYAAPGGLTTGTCNNWTSACELQYALSIATSGDQIWVKAGVHLPTTNPTYRGASFHLKNGVALYGGFDGTETALNQRDFEANLTILSGDIDNNDSQTPMITDINTVTGNTTNSYHVVTGATGATLDGFTITAGYAYLASGGGIYNINSSSPTLSNLIIRGNWAFYGGGGIYNEGIYNEENSNPILTNITFSGNFALNGGGISNLYSNPSLSNVTFSGNSASAGGGMYNDNSSPKLTNVTFDRNSASSGGGIFNWYSHPTLINVTFSGNSASNQGGGISNNLSNPSLINVTISNNLITTDDGWGGGGIFNWQSNPQIYNTLLWGNTGAQVYTRTDTNGSPMVRDSLIQGGCPAGSSCTNIITTNPLLGSLGDHGGFTQTMPLMESSSAIDAGNDVFCPASDQRGIFRPQGARCDIGAYEYDDDELDTRIDTFPSNPSKSATASFTFSSSDNTATFECSLDGAAFTACVSPKSYAGLADDTHTFIVRAKDALGNLDNTPPSYTWSIRTGPLYAKPSATGTSDCTSWANACTLQTALTKTLDDDEIWVAAGVYKPTTNSTDRAATFQLKSGVAIYGGFAGTETMRDQRNPAIHPTILSGDIDNNDSQVPVITNINTVAGNSTNSYHVVTGADGAILDGFTITGGYAIVSAGLMGNGGGFYNENGSPTLRNIIFQGNLAWKGAGLYNSSGSPTLTNVSFIGNLADRYGWGGGVYNFGGSDANLTLTNVTFSRNFAYYGGGMVDSSGSSILTNVTFSENSAAGEGGGIYAANNTQIRNSIFWGNTAVDASPQIKGNPNIRDSIVQDGFSGNGRHIYTGNPNLGDLGNYGGFTPTIPLLNGSSAINLGNNEVCPDIDQRGVARPQNSYCDIGAYEYDLPILPKIHYVKPVVSGVGDCTAWVNACILQTALAKANAGDEIWAAAGTYKPTTNPSDRNAAFRLKGRVAVYGGFVGTETLQNHRNPDINITILSGEIGAVGNGDNSYHVVTNAGYAILDGFTITGGNANSNSSPNDRGGGIYSENNTSTLANLIIRDNFANEGGGIYNRNGDSILTNIILSNNTSNYGGGIYNFQGDLTLKYVIFSENSSSYGGGMYNVIGTPSLTNVIFYRNSADDGQGGGMLNQSASPTLTNITFSNNSAWAGGGMFSQTGNPILTNITFSNNSAGNGGGIFNSSSQTLMTNVTFHNNSAQYYGGAIYNSNSNSTLINATISANSAYLNGGGIYNTNANAQVHNTILWENVAPVGAQIYNAIDSMPGVSNSIVQGGYTSGTNIIIQNPRLGALGNYGGFTETIPLLDGSSAIGVGSDTYCPVTDQRGVIRPQGKGCDIGAYETTTFPDVLTDHWAWAYIERLANAGITSGFPDGTYRPAQAVTRGQMAVFLLKAINGPDYLPPAATAFSFSDIEDHWAADWIEALKETGITGGYPDGTYRPDSPVSRGEMAVFLLKAINGPGYTPPAVTEYHFPDIEDHWASDWIEALRAAGLTGGYPDGTYRPDQAVTRAEMAVFIVNAFGLP